MLCKKCGAQMPDDGVFCPECGANNSEEQQTKPESEKTENTKPENIKPESIAPEESAPTDVTETSTRAETPAQEDQAEPPRKKHGASGRIIAIAAGCVVVLAVVLILVKATGNGGSGTIYHYVDSKEGVLALPVFDAVLDMNGKAKEVEDKVASTCMSIDRKTVCYTTDSGDLYVVRHDLDPVRVAEDIQEARISTDGKFVTYLLDGAIFVYDVDKANKVKVASEVARSGWAMSPDGKSILYVKDEEDGSLYLAGVGRESEKVASNAEPLVVENGGKHYFFAKKKDDGTVLYIGDTREDQKLGTLGRPVLLCNRTGGDILYVDGKDATYVYHAGEPGSVKVMGKTRDEVYLNTLTSFSCSSRTQVIDTASFKGVLLTAEESLYWINDQYEAVKVTSRCGQYMLSEDGGTVLYIANDRLCKTKLNDDMKEEVLYGKETVEVFAASADLSKVYFVTDEDNLYYLTGTDTGEKLVVDFQDDGQMAYNEAERKLYYIDEGDLYSVGSKASSKQRADADADGLVQSMGGCLLKGISYSKDGKIYYKESGEKVPVLDISEYMDASDMSHAGMILRTAYSDYEERSRLQHDNSVIAEIAENIKIALYEDMIVRNISIPYTMVIENSVTWPDDALGRELTCVVGEEVSLSSLSYWDHPVTITISLNGGAYQVAGNGLIFTVGGGSEQLIF